jgi:hypothetical protein
MRPRPAARRGLSALTAVALACSAAGCGDAAPATVPPPTGAAPLSTPPDPGDARVALAARAALAQDRSATALYTLDSGGRPQRSVVATRATDGSWRVDIPGGALGGTADVSVVRIDAGIFQCSLPSATRSVAPTCVKVADSDKRIPRRYDPRVQRIFHDWLNVFTDRRAALSVSTAQPLAGAEGSCFAVDSISASLKAPVDVGIYCYAEDGLLTAARVDLGELRLAAAPAAAPPSVDLPGPVVAGDPMGMDAPPPPPPPSDPAPSASAP